jgi:tetratricopeptide repeat protein
MQERGRAPLVGTDPLWLGQPHAGVVFCCATGAEWSRQQMGALTMAMWRIGAGLLAMPLAVFPLERAALASPPPASAPAPVSSTGDTQRTGDAPNELERRIDELFERGDYAAALPLMEQAYARSGAPRWLYNLGAVHHALGDCVAALEHYQRYVRSGPGAEGRAAATAAISNLQPICGTSEGERQNELAAVELDAVPATSASLEAEPDGSAHAPASVDAAGDEHSSTKAVVGWSLLGAGAATGVTALVSLVLARAAVSSLNELGREAAERSRAGETYDVCCATRGRELESERDRYSTLTPILGVGSLVLLATGATLLVLDLDEQRSFSLGASGPLSAQYRLRF